MDPQIIDHYNEYPSGINVIDKMNEELAEAQKKTNKYAEILSVLVQNKVAGRPLIQPITITKEALSEYSQLLYDIKRKINDQLSESKKVGSIADEEFDLQGVFDNSDRLVEILHSELNSFPGLIVSREWCEYRVEVALDRFKPLLLMQKYWWENMLTDGICDKIIEIIKDSIVFGGTHDLELCELCLVKCDKCHQCETTDDGEEMTDEDGTKKWICYKCVPFRDDNDDDDDDDDDDEDDDDDDSE